MASSLYNLARFDLVTIQLAVSCAQTGSLTAAARESHLAIGAASRRIRDLESTLGTPLFVRHTRGLAATPAGRVFAKHGLTLLQTMKALGSELRDLQLGILRHVSLYSSSAAVVEFLPPLLAEFSRLNPQIRIDVEDHVSEASVIALKESRIDAAIFVEGPDTSGLSTRLFRSDELVLVMPHDHRFAESKQPIEFIDTLDEEWITLATGALLLRSKQQAALRVNRPLKIRMQMGSFEAACHMVGAGLGVAILPKLAILPLVKRLKLAWRPLADEWARRKLLIATAARVDNEDIRMLVDFLAQPSPA